MAESCVHLSSRQRGSGGRQARATIPFSSMSQLGLLQVNVKVEASETSENPTQSFEIHNIVWSFLEAHTKAVCASKKLHYISFVIV